ncbi:universal stress protein [Nocardiopsis sp. NPDC058789]|uniref:universal stress protein n=1 Tax=Nocardiopsis sp. NPDC058789 TaxID=3346634 RepID=UPI00366F214D
MSGDVLVGTDGSRAALAAAVWASEEARDRGARAVVVCVFDPGWPTARATERLRQEAESVVERTRNRMSAFMPGVEVVGEELAGSSPSKVLLERAASVSLVVLGRHGTSDLPGRWPGTVADQVAAHAPVPVVLVPHEPVPTEARDVVVGVDGSSRSKHAALTAVETAQGHGDRVRAVWAWTAPESMVPRGSEAEQELKRWRRENLETALKPVLEEFPDVVVLREVRREHPVTALLADDRHTRMVVVGARGEHGFAELALGGVARGVLNRSDRPVMVVHGSRD